jgi:hypothetical protein
MLINKSKKLELTLVLNKLKIFYYKYDKSLFKVYIYIVCKSKQQFLVADIKDNIVMNFKS